MSGGTSTHSLITMNVGGSLWSRLRDKPCTAYESNMRVKIEATGLRTYPDASVYCEPLKYDPEDPKRTTAVNPTIVIEVLSPSTEGYDRGLKAKSYRLLPTLKAYALVAQDRPHVELHVRQSSGNWTLSDVAGMDAVVRLEAIDVEMPLSEVYARVDFQEGEQAPVAEPRR